MLLSWIVIAEVDLDAYQSIRGDAYLDLESNPGFLKRIGITSTRSYRPWLVVPDFVVWQKITHRVNEDLGSSATGRTSVLTLTDPGKSSPKRYSFNIRLYRPNILAIEVKVLDDISCELADAFDVRQLSAHIAASYVVDLLIGFIKSGNLEEITLGNSSFSRPVIYFPVDVEPDKFSAWKEENKHLLAGLAINNTHWASADPLLADKIFESNRDVDIKYARHATSIINKQGILTAFTSQERDVSKTVAKEHDKRIVFLELAWAMREFTSHMPRLREWNENVTDFLYYLATPMLANGAVLANSVNGTHIWSILSKELALSNSIENLHGNIIKEIEEKFSYFSKFSESEFDSAVFADRVDYVVKRHGKSIIEKFYGRYPFWFWLATTIIAVTNCVVSLYIKLHPSAK
jgi:hypothetical protein